MPQMRTFSSGSHHDARVQQERWQEPSLPGPPRLERSCRGQRGGAGAAGADAAGAGVAGAGGWGGRGRGCGRDLDGLGDLRARDGRGGGRAVGRADPDAGQQHGTAEDAEQDDPAALALGGRGGRVLGRPRGKTIWSLLVLMLMVPRFSLPVRSGRLFADLPRRSAAWCRGSTCRRERI